MLFSLTRLHFKSNQHIHFDNQSYHQLILIVVKHYGQSLSHKINQNQIMKLTSKPIYSSRNISAVQNCIPYL